MSTLGTKHARKDEQIGSSGHTDSRTAAKRYLISAVCVAFFGAVYEIFSHGVYSNFMIYAFAVPLVLGALPNILDENEKINFARSPLWACGITTLTVGSIIKGVLDIYGTTNNLVWVYPAMGAVLLIIAVATMPTRIPAAIPLNNNTGK